MGRYSQTASIIKQNERRDMQELIQLILASPVGEGPLEHISGTKALSMYGKANLDVKTRILMQFAVDAMHGDKKAAEFLFKYGGYEPIKEEQRALDVPVLIEDIPMMPPKETVQVEPPAVQVLPPADEDVPMAPVRRRRARSQRAERPEETRDGPERGVRRPRGQLRGLQLGALPL